MQQPPPLPPRTPVLPRPARRKGSPCLVIVLALLAFCVLMAALAWFTLGSINTQSAARADATAQRLWAEEGVPVTAEQWAESYPPIAEEDNAAPLYLRAYEAMQYLEAETLRERLDASYPDFRYANVVVDEKAIAELLKRNRKAIKQIRLATAKSACRFGVDFDQGNLAGEGLFNDLADLYWLLTYQTVLAVEQGKPKAAAAAIEQALALTRAMAQAPVFEAQCNASWSVQYAADALAFACSRRVFNDEQLVRLRDAFAETADATNIRMVFQSVAAGANVLIGKLRRGEIGVGELAGEDWEYDKALTSGRNPILRSIYANTHRICLEHYEMLIDMGALPPREQVSQITAFEASVAAMAGQPHFAALLLDELSTTAHELLIEEVTQQLVQVAIGIERYHLAHEVLPPDLDGLQGLVAPEHLADPMGTGPLHYRQEDNGYLLYSVAANGTDDDAPELDGDWLNQWQNGDWAYRVGYEQK